MTNTAITLMGDSSVKRSLSEVADQQVPTWTESDRQPPTPPPPPIRARARGMVRPVTRRRAPAVPPPPCVPDEDFLDDMLELDPVLQNERNDVIWQRRVDGAEVAAVAPAVLRDLRPDLLRPRRCPSPSTLAAWTSAPHCRQCRHVDETSRHELPLPLPLSNHDRMSDFVDLNSVSSRADNEYVEDPSSVPDAGSMSSSSVHLRLSDPATDAITSRRLDVPLKSWAKDDGSSTSLRAAVTHSKGVICTVCDGCRCASCQSIILLCSCHAVDDQCRRGRRGRCAVRSVLGACVPCLCPCWLWTVSSCRRCCTNAPHICRCRADSL